MKKRMLKPVRTKAGLGSQPLPEGGSVELTHTAAGASLRITVTGGTQESSRLPPLPPPLVHCPSLSPRSDSPFELAFVSGNIS